MIYLNLEEPARNEAAISWHKAKREWVSAWQLIMGLPIIPRLSKPNGDEVHNYFAMMQTNNVAAAKWSTKTIATEDIICLYDFGLEKISFQFKLVPRLWYGGWSCG